MTKKELRKQIRAAKSQQDPAALAMWSKEISQKILDRLSTLRSQLSTFNTQLSTFNTQLSTFNSQLSTFNSQLSTILLYSPLPDEVDIHPVIDALYAKGITIYLPKVTGDTTMEIRLYEGPQSLKPGAFGILEPTGKIVESREYRVKSGESIVEQKDELSLSLPREGWGGAAIIPGMAFDRAGHRLGRGKGYYDRFLSNIGVYKIGVCYPFQIVDSVPYDAHDILMDEVIY